MRWWLGLAYLVVRRPSIWLTAAVAYRRVIPNGWYRVRPFLPLPDREYLEYRFHTVGGPERITQHEAVAYLYWLKALPS